MPLSPLTVDEVKGAFGAFTYTDNPYGSISPDPAWKAANLVTVMLPGIKGHPVCTSAGTASGKATCHRKVAPLMQAAFAEVVARNLDGDIRCWDGSYMARHINFNVKKGLSNHAWGTAFDINVAWNRQGKKPALPGTEGSVHRLVPIFEAYGFFWGGHFNGTRVDGMHFEFANLKLLKTSAAGTIAPAADILLECNQVLRPEVILWLDKGSTVARAEDLYGLIGSSTPSEDRGKPLTVRKFFEGRGFRVDWKHNAAGKLVIRVEWPP